MNRHSHLMSEIMRSSASFDDWDRKEGTPGPMGVSFVPAFRAWNFALYSRRALGVTLLLYSAEETVRPLLEVRLDPRVNKSGRIWHYWIPAEQAFGAKYYAYRVAGHRDPQTGFTFDAEKILLDPFAPAVFFPKNYDRAAACQPGPNDGRAPLGVLPVPSHNSHATVARNPRPSFDLIVYELHVKGQSQTPRHLRRLDGKNPLSQRPRHHRRRTHADSSM